MAQEKGIVAAVDRKHTIWLLDKVQSIQNPDAIVCGNDPKHGRLFTRIDMNLHCMVKGCGFGMSPDIETAKAYHAHDLAAAWQTDTRSSVAGLLEGRSRYNPQSAAVIVK